MEERISVIVKQPGRDPERVELDNTLEALQKAVGGFIETVTINDKVVVICDEEGRLKDLEPNCNVFGHSFAGPIIFAGVGGEEFASLPSVISSKVLEEFVIRPYAEQAPSAFNPDLGYLGRV